MDDIVKQALARWPNVPHCTGWLRLDGRGHWRLRDEADQAQGAPGTPVRHEALNAFINRNYESDASGQWFFQNGPQRVYVELEYTPWIVRLMKATDGALKLTDHTGNAFDPVAAYADEQGGVLFTNASGHVALLHDHDLDGFAEHATLDDNGESGVFHWRAETDLPLQAIARAEVPARFGFIQSPEHKEKAEKA
ncbi:MAG TPA: DUF2946 family protein [Paraburkholderia sp.]|jgi:hypothetical protein|uniref:DUF2946 family protein n=1 Tax=Paraburkholderia sp. TaxID=1926495 RepID=UPI002DEAF1DF|nr:DUF2946 family protein [Paraburkholderia sp.]